MVSAMSVLEKIRNPRLDRRPKKVTESDGTGKRSSEFDSFRGCSWLSRGNYFLSTLTLDHQLFREIIKRRTLLEFCILCSKCVPRHFSSFSFTLVLDPSNNLEE